MKKLVSKIMAVAMAAAMIICSMGAMKTQAADSYTGFLMFSDRNWAYDNWDATTNAQTTCTVTGDGTYTVAIKATDLGADGTTPCNGAQVFCVDILDLAANATPVLAASDVIVKCDGVEIAVDQSKIKQGDIEEKGNFRIELYNEYGDTFTDGSAVGDQTTFSFTDTLEVTFTLTGTGIAAAAEEPAADTTATLPQTGVVSAAALCIAGAALIAGGAAVTRKGKED